MREVIFTGNVARIPLGQSHETLVDLDVFLSNALFGFPWAIQTTRSCSYAYRRLYFSDGTERGVKIYMHRLILKPPPGMGVDHRNGDGLDNRLANLRVCSQAENTCNKRMKATHTYLGVFWKKDKQKWRAAICKNRHQYHLGYFEAEVDAARAYNAAATRLFGEFARLNPV